MKFIKQNICKKIKIKCAQYGGLVWFPSQLTCSLVDTGTIIYGGCVNYGKKKRRQHYWVTEYSNNSHLVDVSYVVLITLIYVYCPVKFVPDLSSNIVGLTVLLTAHVKISNADDINARNENYIISECIKIVRKRSHCPHKSLINLCIVWWFIFRNLMVKPFISRMDYSKLKERRVHS